MINELSSEQKRRRALALAVIVAAYVLSFFQRFAPAGIAQDLAAAFQTSAASLGALAATYFYVYTLMQLPTGVLADTLGPRRVLLTGGFIAGLGSVGFGLATSFEAAFVARTLIGLGVSVVFVSMLKFISVWFEERRFASIVGISMLLGNIGSVFAGSPLSWLAGHLGWRRVFVGVGVLSLVLGALAWLLVRDRPPADGPAKATPRLDRTAILGALWQVMKNRATWPAVFTNAGLAGSFFAFGGLWATPFLIQAWGMTRVSATQHVSLLFAGFAVGCLLLGALSDRLQRRKSVVAASALLYGLIWLALIAGVTAPPFVSYPLFALMGVMTASFTLTWACAKEVNPPQLAGISTAFTNMGGFLMGALLQPAVGWVMDLRWKGEILAGVRLYAPEDFRWGLALIALSAWLGALAAWFLHETRCRNVWKESP
ncbi:MAG: MFS transporter [Rhodocyclaceae bacterium]|nr:MFS transporter [Rhodocyclaceae bacterium]